MAAFEGFKCSATVLGFLLKLFSYHGVEKVAREVPFKRFTTEFVSWKCLPSFHLSGQAPHKTAFWFVLKTAAEILRLTLYFEVKIIGTPHPPPVMLVI